MVRKEITDTSWGFRLEDESEMLILLGNLKHRNIVTLLDAYVHNGIYNLLFSPADMDLKAFLLLEYRKTGFEEDRSILKAIYGLSCGLKHLHYFELESPYESLKRFHGTHHDIKPGNILVRGLDFILADFGLSRLKPVDEDSRTVWKAGTFEYGSPECRDPLTWEHGNIGRASDIWSLGCIVSELIVYMRNGSKGVQEFRQARVADGPHGKASAFHDGECLKQSVIEVLSNAAETNPADSDSYIFELIKEMFAPSPENRPNAKQVENRLERVAMKALVQDLLDSMGELELGTNVFRTKLRLEKTRFSAWVGLLGLTRLGQETAESTSQLPAPFFELFETIEDAIKDTKARRFESDTQNKNSILSSIHRFNDSIYEKLPERLRATADGLFHILFATNDDNLQPILAMNEAATHGYDDIRKIAQMRHMSILLQQDENFKIGKRLEKSLVPLDMDLKDSTARPPTRWYYYGYKSDDQKRRVLVESRSYRQKSNLDIGREELQKHGEAIFHRIQELVMMLGTPKPTHFRVLDCLGAYHDPDQREFGIVYALPKEETTLFRLHYLLKNGGRPKNMLPPNLTQKFALATNLATCLQSLHISGWVHKDINSWNIIFFRSTTPCPEDWKPYLIGFQHSRQDEQGAYSTGPESLNPTKRYQHPSYRSDSIPFRREFDYYSLGVVLLEIGAWESLSVISDKPPYPDPFELRRKYIEICDTAILERMGEIYHMVTKKCLEVGSQPIGTEMDAAIDFQREMIEKLESCRV